MELASSSSRVVGCMADRPGWQLGAKRALYIIARVVRSAFLLVFVDMIGGHGDTANRIMRHLHRALNIDENKN